VQHRINRLKRQHGHKHRRHSEGQGALDRFFERYTAAYSWNSVRSHGSNANNNPPSRNTPQSRQLPPQGSARSSPFALPPRNEAAKLMSASSFCNCEMSSARFTAAAKTEITADKSQRQTVSASQLLRVSRPSSLFLYDLSGFSRWRPANENVYCPLPSARCSSFLLTRFRPAFHRP